MPGPSVTDGAALGESPERPGQRLGPLPSSPAITRRGIAPGTLRSAFCRSQLAARRRAVPSALPRSGAPGLPSEVRNSSKMPAAVRRPSSHAWTAPSVALHRVTSATPSPTQVDPRPHQPFEPQEAPASTNGPRRSFHSSSSTERGRQHRPSSRRRHAPLLPLPREGRRLPRASGEQEGTLTWLGVTPEAMPTGHRLHSVTRGSSRRCAIRASDSEALQDVRY